MKRKQFFNGKNMLATALTIMALSTGFILFSSTPAEASQTPIYTYNIVNQTADVITTFTELQDAIAMGHNYFDIGTNTITFTSTINLDASTPSDLYFTGEGK